MLLWCRAESSLALLLFVLVPLATCKSGLEAAGETIADADAAAAEDMAWLTDTDALFEGAAPAGALWCAEEWGKCWN